MYIYVYVFVVRVKSVIMIAIVKLMNFFLNANLFINLCHNYWWIYIYICFSVRTWRGAIWQVSIDKMLFLLNFPEISLKWWWTFTTDEKDAKNSIWMLLMSIGQMLPTTAQVCFCDTHMDTGWEKCLTNSVNPNNCTTLSGIWLKKDLCMFVCVWMCATKSLKNDLQFFSFSISHRFALLFPRFFFKYCLFRSFKPFILFLFFFGTNRLYFTLTSIFINKLYPSAH